jgi:SPP1 family predicted phage head-tail adaptor
MTNIAAGRLRHIIAIERQVEVTDSNGDRSREWEYVTSVRAEIKPMSGRELLLAQQVQSQVSVNIVIRYNADIDATCRAKYNGVIYSIQAVIPDPESGLEWMTLPCSVGTNDG